MTTLSADVKPCTRCKEVKSLGLFSKNKRTPDGYKYVCKTCISSDYFKNQDKEKAKRKAHYNGKKSEYIERSYNWREQNPEKRQLSEKKRSLKKKYGLEWATYINMMEAQDGRCAICNTPLSVHANEHFPSACVDHCHKTGKIRGLLCYSCNLVLGYARDDVAILESAKAYLNGTFNG